MFSFRLAAAIVAVVAFASSAEAADRYYVAPGTGDGTILYDRPLSVALARCYGLVDGAVRAAHAKKNAVPAELSDALIALGGDLVDAAKQDRGLAIKLDTFRPETYDDQGIPDDTGAPGGLYMFYDDAERAAEQGNADVDLRPCRALLADIKANRNIGAPRERVYPAMGGQGEPLVLALAYCYGEVDSSDWDGGYLDEAELKRDRASMGAALIAAAKRDRGVTLLPSDLENGSLPTALQYERRLGDDSLSVMAGRPDFQDVADQEYPDVWSDCQKVLEAAK